MTGEKGGRKEGKETERKEKGGEEGMEKERRNRGRKKEIRV